MTFWAILILLVLVAGLVAYVGDTVAKRVGKRHWRFLGLRPRATGTVVAIGTGVLIALGAFGTFFLLVRDARETILQAEQVRIDRDRLRGEVSRYSNQIQLLESRAAQTFAENERLKEDRVEFERNIETQARQLEQTVELQKQTRLELENVLTEREKLLQEVDKLGKASQQQKLALDQLEKNRQTLLSEKQALLNEKDQLKASREQLALQVAKVEKQLRDLEAASRTARTRYNDLLAQTKELDSRVRQLEADKRTLEGDVAVLVGGSAKPADTKNQTKTLDALQKENADLRNKLVESQRDLQQLRERGKLLVSTLDKALQQSLLAEQPLEPGSEAEALQEVLRRSENRARLLGLRGIEATETPALSNLKAGLLLARSAGINAEGKVRVRVEYRAKERAFSAGDVLAIGTLVLPTTMSEMRRKLDSLSQQAEEKLAQAGWIPEKLAQGGVSFEEFANFAAQASQIPSKKGFRVAVVALDNLYPTDPPKLGIRLVQ